MAFGYFPDFASKSKLKDWYLKFFGYPYPPRRNEAIMVFDFLNPKPEEKILDLGCGDGIFTNELAKCGAKVAGVDISDHDLGIAKKRARLMGLRVEYIQGDAQKMQFKNESFDKVMSISTLEHIKDDCQVLKEVFRVLKPRGTLVLSVPLNRDLWFLSRLTYLRPKIKKFLLSSFIANSQNPEEYHRNLDKKFHHFRRYPPQQIINLLSKIGFVNLTFKYHINLLSRFPHCLIHGLKIFEWQKSSSTGYSYSSRGVFIMAGLFPTFYLFYYLDRCFFSSIPGYTIIVKAQKPKNHAGLLC